MSFKIQLYSFAKHENSTAQPSTVPVEFDCVTNTDFDIIAPTFPLNIGANSNPAAYNYMYVPSFQKYYFINDWYFSRGLWNASCTEDYMGTFKSEIAEQVCYVLRCASEYDGAIIDNFYPTTTDVRKSVVDGSAPWVLAGSYVAGIVGGNGITEYYALGSSLFNFANAIFSDAFWNEVKGDDITDTLLRAQFNPLQYITSIMWFPLTVGAGSTRAIKLGYWDSGYNAGIIGNNPLTPASITFSIPKHPQANARGVYLNVAPYTQYELTVLPFGHISIDATKLQNATSLVCDLKVDPINGMGTCTIHTDVSTAVIAVMSAQIGQPVQISQVVSDYLGAVQSVATGGANMASSILAGDIGATIAGSVSAIGNAITALMPTVSTLGQNGGRSSFSYTPQLSATFLPIVDEDNENHGRPLCQMRRIGDLEGYIMTSQPEPSINCTQNELQQIINYMQTGFYYE